ncbi:MAG: type I pullulanase, partial [Clostridiales bacterium]|nr:type I pullulanase [Clostridiales bacterium]
MKRFLASVSVLLVLCMTLFSCGKKGNTPDEEYTLPLEDGKKQLTIYYNRPGGYDDADVWLWYGSVAGRGYLFHECAYGAKVVVNVPESIEEVGFIIRVGCSDPGGDTWGTCEKDGTQDDRKVKLTGRETVIYTKAGDGNSYISDDGGKTLQEMRSISLADMRDLTHIKYILSSGLPLTAADVKLSDSAGNAVAIKNFAHNYANGTLETQEPLDITQAYTLSVTGMDPVTVVPLGYFDSEEFAQNYTYTGKLGVELSASRTVFRLWAPTASEVTLNLYAAGNGGTAQTHPCVKGEKGVWSYTAESNLSGQYYTYTVTTAAGRQTAVDPYAVSAGINGNRGMVLDLSSTDPVGWTDTPYVPAGVENYTDAEIWEIHVRDFSQNITRSLYKGKFLAFTETGLTNANGVPVGVDYIKDMGYTHVHLLPSFDFASVNESQSAGFNWGYDPQNYNVPEGSYSTDATRGEVRVREFKQMVQALHANGIGVIMDVVYNHTYDGNSNFNKIVPYYYYRYQTNGAASNGSGCGNETASDRPMFRKFMLESIAHWQTEYNVDGFRFDLMALHDTATMQAIEKEVHARNPYALLYGEGWTGGTSALAANKQSTLANLKAVNAQTETNGIAMFNDVIRDAIKGSVFDAQDVGFATGAKESAAAGIRFGVNGGVTGAFAANTSWSAYNPTNVINYASAHDNHTLWDRISVVYGEEQNTLSDRMRRNALSAAIVQTSLGVPFMQAGEEMLRSKKNADGTYNENSYNASDAVNNLQWDLLKTDAPQYSMSRYYKGLIAFRKSSTALRQATAANACALNAQSGGALLAFTVTDGTETLFVVYNASESAKTVTLPAGNWNLHVNAQTAGANALQEGLSGAQSIEKIACYVYR